MMRKKQIRIRGAAELERIAEDLLDRMAATTFQEQDGRADVAPDPVQTEAETVGPERTWADLTATPRSIPAPADLSAGRYVPAAPAELTALRTAREVTGLSPANPANTGFAGSDRSGLTPVGAWTAEDLSEAFRRDARRYDNGFAGEECR